MKRKVFLLTVKAMCAPSLTDSYMLIEYLRSNGLYTASMQDADFILVHTCAFTKALEDSAVEQIRFAKSKKKSSAKVIVIGCLPSINNERVMSVSPDYAISQRELHKLDHILSAKIKLADIKYSKPDEAADDAASSDYPLRVGWGCEGSCSYCAIKNVFGRPRSRAISDIVEELKTGLGMGYKSFYLVANEIGCYGVDIDATISDLVRAMMSVDDDYKIRLSSFMPNEFKLYFDTLKNYIKENRINYIYLACQSGSDKVLKLMRRRYSVGDFKQCIDKVVKANPAIQFRTDIIVGFPGELEKDFRETLSLVRWLSKFSVRIQTIPFSVRPNTAVEKMSGHLRDEVIFNRDQRLDELLARLHKRNPRFVHVD